MKRLFITLLTICYIITLMLGITLKARASDNFTVTFNGNGGTPLTSTASGGAAGVILPAAPVKNGFLFNGWNTAADGSGKNITANMPVKEDLTVYAQWKEDAYPVTYLANGGVPEVQTVNGNKSGPVFPEAPTREGYEFDGWNTKADGSGTSFTQSTQVTEPIAVYAMWEHKKYNVTFNGSGGNGWDEVNRVRTGTINGTDFPETVPEPEQGYVFAGWSTSAAGPVNFKPETPVTEDVTVFAVWEEDGYNVSFYGNGGTPIKSNVTGNNKGVMFPAAPTREDYKFIGWYKETSGTTPFTPEAPVTADISVYAMWERETYDVTFNANGGFHTVIKKGGKTGTDMPQIPVNFGLTFEGWNTKPDGTGTEFTASTPVTGNIMVYAIWSPYFVKFDGNGGELQINDDYAPIYDRVLVCLVRKTDTGSIKLPDIYSNKPGYDFSGWNTKPDGSGNTFTADSPITSNMTVYAMWTKSNTTYTVTFDAGYNGTFSNGDQQVTASGTIDGVTFPAEPTKTDMKFIYYTDIYTGKIYTETTPITKNTELTANYAPVQSNSSGNEKWLLSTSYNYGDNGNDIAYLIISHYMGSETEVTMPSELIYDDIRYTVNGNTVSKGPNSPNTVTYKLECGQNIFEDNLNIVSVSIPNGIESITLNMFRRCVNLRTVNIPATVRYIGSYAFKECINLENLTLSENIEAIYSQAFYNCIKLKDITASEDTIIPSGLKTIDDYSFFRSGLTGSIDLSYIDYLDNHAFEGCEGLTGVTFLNNINTGEYAGNNNTQYIFNDCVNLTSVQLGNLTKLENYAFYNTGIKELTIPACLTSIGNAVFQNCDSLKTVTFEEGITEIGAMFNDCDRLETVNIPSTVKKMGSYTFLHCDSLEKIGLPEGLNELTLGVFFNCYGLHEINLPSTLMKIANIFGSDYNLKSIYYPTLTPPAVTDLSDYTNSDCTIKAKVLYPAAGHTAWEPANSTSQFWWNYWYPVSNLTLHHYNGSVTKSMLILEKFTLKGSAPAPIAREGRSFLGWSTVKGDASKIFDFSNSKITADMELYDCWDEETYDISFNHSFNNSLYMQGTTRSDGTTATPADPERTGYRFIGWNTAADGSGEFISDNTVFNADTSVYSIWESAYYAVKFMSNSGSPSIVNAKGSLEGTSLPSNIKREGYTLTGWKTASGQEFRADTQVAEPITVYAQWNERTFNVTFNGNEGSPSPLTFTGSVSGVSVPNNPTRENYSFTGWNTSREGTGIWFAFGEPILADITYYAQWGKKKFGVTFNAQDGILSGDKRILTLEVDYNSSIQEPEIVPTPLAQGYIFAGWFTDCNYSSESRWDFKNDKVTKNTVLFARWVHESRVLSINKDEQGTAVSAVLCLNEDYSGDVLIAAAYTNGQMLGVNMFTLNGSNIQAGSVSVNLIKGSNYKLFLLSSDSKYTPLFWCGS